jgi:hypothetical protein
MVLSRFWSVMIAGSILYILGLLAAGRLYSIAHIVNGKQNDPLVVAEVLSLTLSETFLTRVVY